MPRQPVARDIASALAAAPGSDGAVVLGEVAVCAWRTDFTPFQLGDTLWALGEITAAHLLPAGTARLADTELALAAGDLVIVDAAASLSIHADVAGAGGVSLVGGTGVVAAAVPAGGPGLYRSAANAALARYLRALVLVPGDATAIPAAGAAAGAAALELLAAAVQVGGAPSHADRREAALLDRAAIWIDANLDRPLDTQAIAAALGCSRAGLYRAAARVGGVAALVLQRRLAGAQRLLADPQEAGSIAAIARAHGFDDPAQFNRRFRRSLGVTPGEVRRQARRGRAGASG